MRKGFIFLIVLFSCINSVYAKHLHTEKEYQAQWCNARKGIMEYKLDDRTRVDCLLPTMAVEVDFANKWAECIGQALYYGEKTKRAPACVLITENPEKDFKYIKRFRYAVYNKKKIPEFKTFTITPDKIVPVNYEK